MFNSKVVSALFLGYNGRVMGNQEITQKIEPILKKYGVSYAGLFGSRSRGEVREDSDLDLLVKFNTPRSLFELVGLEDDLSKTLDLPVDLVTEGALSPLLKAQIDKDIQTLYGER